MKLSTWTKIHKVSRMTAWRMCQDGRLRTERRNGRIFVNEDHQERPPIRNLVGRRFKALVVEADTGRRNRLQEPIWLARCDCGGTGEASGYMLRSGLIKSCGCGRGAPVPIRQSGVGELSRERWAKIVRGTSRRGVQVPLTQTVAWELFVRQGRRCAMTGWQLTLTEAALDYHPHPPRWIHQNIAKILLFLPEECLQKLSRAVAAFSESAEPQVAHSIDQK